MSLADRFLPSPHKTHIVPCNASVPANRFVHGFGIPGWMTRSEDFPSFGRVEFAPSFRAIYVSLNCFVFRQQAWVLDLRITGTLCITDFPSRSSTPTLFCRPPLAFASPCFCLPLPRPLLC